MRIRTGILVGLSCTATAALAMDDVPMFGAPFTEIDLDGGTVVIKWATAGDFDGDGTLDVAAIDDCCGNAGKVHMASGDGDGTFTDVSSVAVADGVLSPEAADLDNDGDLDLVLFHGDQISILLNDGQGTFTVNTTLSLSGIDDHAIGDIDDDGDTDFVVIRNNSSIVSVMNNGLLGNTLQLSTSSFAYTDAEQVALGDLSSDDVADLAVASETTLTLYENDGSGAFAWAKDVQLDDRSLGQMAIATVDDNGWADIVLARLIEPTGTGNDDPYWGYDIRFGNGNMGVLGHDLLDSALENIRDFDLTDVDGDDCLDLVGINEAGLYIRMQLVGPEQGRTLGAPGGRTVEFSDFNNDGIDDILSAGHNGVSVHLGFGNDAFHGQTGSGILPGDARTGDIEIVELDLTATLNPDIIQLNRDSFGVSLSTNAANFDLVVTFDVGPVPTNATRFAINDVNGDLYNDVAILDAAFGKVWVHHNKGLGFGAIDFEEPDEYSVPFSMDDIETADFINLGEPLIILGQDEIGMLEPTGNGTFQPYQKLLDAPAGRVLTAMAIGDADNDGDRDIVVAYRVASNVGIFILAYNHQSQLFGFDGTYYQASGQVSRYSSIRMGDVDNDGDLDVVGSSNGGEATTWVNLGSSTAPFFDATVLQSKLNEAVDTPFAFPEIELVDLTNNGWLDIVASGTNPPPNISSSGNLVSVGLSNGDGTFSHEGLFTAMRPDAVAVGHLNLNVDSLPDVVTGGFSTNHYVDDLFQPCTLLWQVADCYADFNGDCNVDFLDLVDFQVAHQAGDPAADCDGNGVLDLLDYVCFQTVHTAGCN